MCAPQRSIVGDFAISIRAGCVCAQRTPSTLQHMHTHMAELRTRYVYAHVYVICMWPAAPAPADLHMHGRSQGYAAAWEHVKCVYERDMATLCS